MHHDSLPAPIYDAASAIQLLNSTPSKEEVAAFGPPPAPRKGFITFFDPGWSIIQLTTVRGVLYRDWWYAPDHFAQATGCPRYCQVRMECIPGSYGKTFNDQVALLPKEEEVPVARQVLTALILHFLRTGERLLPQQFVRSASLTSKRALRVIVGNFDHNGLRVDSYRDDDPLSHIGLVSSWKF